MSEQVSAPLVLVGWVDSANVTTRWEDREAVIKDGIRFATDAIYSCGFLIAERKDVIVLALSYNHHNDDVGHVIAIPTRAVESITHLRGVRGAKMPKGVTTIGD